MHESDVSGVKAAAKVEPFVVKHYTSEERPTIKGNGFDGLEVGSDREEAQEFVDWINARIAGVGVVRHQVSGEQVLMPESKPK
jgi:hypothetical protein